MTPPATEHRSLERAARGGAVAAFVLFALLLTYGKPWQLLPRETLGNFYDAQAQAFRHGHLDVAPDEVSFEGFLIGKRTYEYQGPVPAVMRLPVVALTDRFHGRLTRVSMLAAYAVALWFLLRLRARIRDLVRGDSAATRGEAWATGFLVFGTGASSLLYLGSKAWVYHEAILWGAAFSLGAFDHLTAWMARRTGSHAVDDWWGDRHAVWAAVFTTLALLTRASMGAGPVAAMALASALQVRTVLRVREADRGGTAQLRMVAGGGLLVLLAGVVVPVGLYATINNAKFGSLFGLPLDKQVLVQFDKERQASLKANGDSLFGVRYAPSVVLQTLRPDALGLRGVFPYVGFPAHRPRVIGSARFAELDWSSSVPSSEPLLFLLGLVGIGALVSPERLGVDRAATALRVPVLGALAGGGAFCVLGYIANRYLSDLFPLVALASITGFHVVAARVASASAGRGRRAAPVRLPVLPIAVGALALLGAWANLGLGLQYQREIAPGPAPGARAAWIRWQSRLGPTPSFTRVGLDQPLPAHPALGAIAVVGDCAAVYRSDGSIWQLVEGSGPTGRFDVDLTLRRSVRLPVTVISAVGVDRSNRLVLESAGGDQVRFVATVTDPPFGVTRSLPGPAFSLERGRPAHLVVTFDWRSGYAEVLAGDRQLLASTIALDRAVPRLDRSFPGTIVARPARARACHALGA